MNISFIGAGKVGISFGKFLINNDLNVLGYFDKNIKNLNKALEITKTKKIQKKEMILKSDIIFITVNDDNIENVINDSIKEFKRLDNKTFIHMSGAHSSKLLINAYNKGADIYSLHPLQSVSNIENAILDFENTVFSVETINEELNESICIILNKLKSYFEIESDKKAIYHMAACVFSNYLTTIIDFGLELTSSLGIDKDYAFNAMKPLINSTLKNIEKNGVENSLTGPLSRGDKNTIKTHLETYNNNNEEYKSFYEFMGIRTLDYIKKNNILSEETINDLTKILEENNEKDNN